MDNLLEQLEQWNKNDEFSRCIEAIEAIPVSYTHLTLPTKQRV